MNHESEAFSEEKLNSLCENVAKNERENLVTGILGAFVMSLLGAALYIAIYQFGYIAGLCGLATYMLAYWGYRKCSGSSDSMKGIIISILMTVIALFIAEFLCLTCEIYRAYAADFEITFLDALKLTPDFLVDPEILPSFLKDLAVSYFLCILACGSTVSKTIQSKRKEAK